ncbi:GIY-YIG nuclease family protein [Bacillus sp. EAC]|uniref:GIY-YIG nuclease family protein n=1 Tax=Bacillus sp. EAC TaxID=1978338 RepID=UPI000B4393BD|nr:GIY-YIG nuclease family protein [Bacillus sp. EAC]
MNRKKELKLQYMETKKQAGVYQIKNTINQKVFIGSTMNFKTLNGKKFELEMGTSTNKVLQDEWNEFGKEAFIIEELETLKIDSEKLVNEKAELKKLEEKWLNQLQPFGDKGYNSVKSR